MDHQALALELTQTWSEWVGQSIVVEIESLPLEHSREKEKQAGADVRARLKAKGCELQSISHTSGILLGVGAAQGKRVLRLGVDLERRERQLSARLARRIGVADEYRLGLTPLDLWVLKEAAYKANPRSAGTYLSQYRVQGCLPPFSIAAPQFEGAAHLLRMECDEVVVALCFLPCSHT